MNILFDTLPNHLEVCGKQYPIRTSFRDGLRVMVACEDNELTTQEKNAVILANVYEEQPPNYTEALEMALWFLDGGKRGGGEPGLRLFSFDKDAGVIYAAFRQTHGIDLTNAELHWWQFLALFGDLGSDTAFCQLVALRSRVKRGKATKEERQVAADMGEAFDLPELDSRTIEEMEQEREFLRLVGV